MTDGETPTIVEGSAQARILAATRTCLHDTGYAGLSTRRIAERAGLPLSQIHYHFGSKGQLVLALLDAENARLLERQSAMYDADTPLWQQWDQACDYLEDDLRSGYVRVLQEMIAAGWSDPAIAAAVRRDLRGWYDLLTAVARRAAARLGGLGPFSAEEVAALVGNAFLGTEALVLLGLDDDAVPGRAALRQVGALIRRLEEADDRARP